MTGGHLNYEFAQADYTRTPAKPVVNGEARYEADKGATPLDVRRSAWWSYLAGAAFSYGHINNWKSPSSWREWVDAPGAKQVQVIGRLLRSLAGWKLVPDQKSSLTPAKELRRASADGDWILVYLTTNAPSDSQVGLRHFVENGGGFMDQSAQWRENNST